jgi:hypothetical protein
MLHRRAAVDDPERRFDWDYESFISASRKAPKSAGPLQAKRTAQ